MPTCCSSGKGSGVGGREQWCGGSAAVARCDVEHLAARVCELDYAVDRRLIIGKAVPQPGVSGEPVSRCATSCFSANSLVTNRCPSEIRSTSIAIASMPCPSRSNSCSSRSNRALTSGGICGCTVCRSRRRAMALASGTPITVTGMIVSSSPMNASNSAGIKVVVSLNAPNGLRQLLGSSATTQPTGESFPVVGPESAEQVSNPAA
jgi:hypothetical protein